MNSRAERLTFGLIHGGAHGAWCWDRVMSELATRGHDAIAMELPCEDENAGASEYADVIVHALADVTAPVVLVAHSLGGLSAPIVAARRPVRQLIFVSALLPRPGWSFQQQRERETIMFPYHGGTAGLRDRFYNRCDPADADWAMARLRPQAITPFTETTPLRQWPAVPASYIVCTADRACSPAWGRRAARTLLGIEAVELVGADHSPMISCPAELADLLVSLARPGAADTEFSGR